MALTVWINGRFVDKDQATVSAFDAGFVHGVGLFETMLAAPLPDDPASSAGRVFRVHKHMERMEASARALGMAGALKVRALQELVEHVVERSGLTGPDAGPGARARVRLTVSGGDLNMLSSGGQGPTDPGVVVVVQPATRYPAEMFERGVSAVVADVRANPLNPYEGHKTLNYWWRLGALQAAAASGAGEAIILQVTNHVCGGAVSNLFAVHDGSLLTPMCRGEELGGALPSPVLPGVTRGAIIDAAQALRVGVARRLVPIADVLDAQEVFLTNASWGVLPVVRVEGKQIGDGAPGPVTRALREAWLGMVDHEP